MEATTSRDTNVENLLKLPRLDWAAALESRRKDFLAVKAANMTVLTGIQSFGQKQATISSTMTFALQSLAPRPTATASEPATHAEERAPQAWRHALLNMREMADNIYKTQTDCIAIVTKRVAENIEELKSLLHVNK